MSRFLKAAAETLGGPIIGFAIGGKKGALVGLSGSIALLTGGLPGLAATALMNGLSAQFTPKQSNVGAPSEWRANPDQGIDLVFGDAYNAGGILLRLAHGKKNKYETIVSSWSLGPVAGGFTLYVDGRETSVTGQTVNIEDRGKMYTISQVGRCPEPAALMLDVANPPGWTAAHKISGKAAFMDLFVYDVKGGKTFTSIPNLGRRGKGLLCYDPRKDSTYPGGEGPQRWNDQTTWAWSNNAPIGALTFAIGWRQNGKLAAGCGMDIVNILVDQFVEAANVNDANGWTFGGVKSTTDDPHDVMVDILQAGGCELVQLGARLGCLVSTPRVRLATIDRNCLAQGAISVPAMASRRTRINGITPTYLFEQKVTTEDSSSGDLVTQTSWAMAPGVPIVVADYVAADGKERRKPVSYPMVQCFAGQQPTQVAQLARYDIENAREIDGISLPLKLRWYGYKPGDCIGVDLPEAGLINRDVLIRNRELEPGTSVVTMTLRSETASKHAFALGQTTTPPTSPSTMSLPDLGASAPAPGDWLLSGETLTSSSGSIPALALALRDQTADEIAAGDDVVDASVEAIITSYRTVPIILGESGSPLFAEDGSPIFAEGGTPGAWKGATLNAPTMEEKDITEGIVPGMGYQVSVSYRTKGVIGDPLILGPVVAGDLGTSRGAFRIASQSVDYPVTTDASTITIAAFNGILDDGRAQVFPAGEVTGLVASTNYGLFFRFADSSYLATASPSEAEMASKAFVFIGWAATSDGAGIYPTSPTPPGGAGGAGSHPSLA